MYVSHKPKIQRSIPRSKYIFYNDVKCFITLSDSQAKKILVGLESEQNVLSKKEIDKLTDYDSLKDMSQNELKRKS